jgi:hypothetical protein
VADGCGSLVQRADDGERQTDVLGYSPSQLPLCCKSLWIILELNPISLQRKNKAINLLPMTQSDNVLIDF